MNKKRTYGISVGTSFILVIIVILSLVCFAGLSIVSANADYRLSQKLADRTTSYYEAASLANENLAGLHEAFATVYAESADEASYLAKIKESYADSLTFSYAISDTQSLCVSIVPLYPEAAQGDYFTIEQFQVVTTSELTLDESLPVLFHD